jgi:hypothetical protein
VASDLYQNFDEKPSKTIIPAGRGGFETRPYNSAAQNYIANV